MVLSDKYNHIETSSGIYVGQHLQPMSDNGSKVAGTNNHNYNNTNFQLCGGLMIVDSHDNKRNSQYSDKAGTTEEDEHRTHTTTTSCRAITPTLRDTKRFNSNNSIESTSTQQQQHQKQKQYQQQKGTILKFASDENRNSVVIEAAQTIDFTPTNVLEVTTTEITERKTKKKTSALQNFRNLVKATVVTLESSSHSEQTSDHPRPRTISSSSNKDASTNCGRAAGGGLGQNTEDKKATTRKNRKKGGLARYRKKKNRRSRVIPNEGAPLWQPMVKIIVFFQPKIFFHFLVGLDCF